LLFLFKDKYHNLISTLIRIEPVKKIKMLAAGWWEHFQRQALILSHPAQTVFQ